MPGIVARFTLSSLTAVQKFVSGSIYCRCCCCDLFLFVAVMGPLFCLAYGIYIYVNNVPVVVDSAQQCRKLLPMINPKGCDALPPAACVF